MANSLAAIILTKNEEDVKILKENESEKKNENEKYWENNRKINKNGEEF